MNARTVGGVVALVAIAAALLLALTPSSHAQALQSAGDLNNDGKLDFLIEMPSHGGTTIELWLSSHAGPARYTEAR